MKETTCCFTGHRNIRDTDAPTIMKRTEHRILALLEKGVTDFMVGGAIGYDTMVAELLFHLRDEHPQIRVILAYPFEGYTSAWKPLQQETYERILPKYDKAVCVAQKGGSKAFLERDRYMVDHSTYCIAYCTRNSGGTAYTVRYATKQGVEVINTADTATK